MTWYFISSCSRYACDLCNNLNLFLYKIMLYFDLSGWFDAFTFKRWFVDLFFPQLLIRMDWFSCLETILGHISVLIWSNWPSKTVFALSCSQQMQLIGSKYSSTPSSGFHCWGLYPLDRNEVLKRLPERATWNLHSTESINISLHETLIELLKENCDHSEEDKIKRGKKIQKKKKLVYKT